MAWSEALIQYVWNRATTVDGFDKSHFRKDACGAWIIREKYGDIDSLYGWEIDHIVPKVLLVEKGYTQMDIDNCDNLRALQHDNNVSKSDDYPSYTAVVTSDGTENVTVTKYLEVNEKKQEILRKLYNL
ncbi:MAG: hypothetical protein IJ256_00440 [Bacteroidaceae bacterium]|nr:hypothetical protein [Bacteroidaceae bacterium]